ncbi:MAG: ATP-grasp domain protein [Candidatus Levybacteria bacterium GW2011_GWA2_40_16]|nr:MAG: ATP-grasp domain protein [Candidatus Levybacteria bacterium GW2011_GWA1_39_11]KKR49811.1 MAG: ATP-grasp domain protein [Candidatus Levybacteria bacterium GW2011_GWA2_40_16]
MARVKLSEFRAKQILGEFLGEGYSGFPFDTEKDDEQKIGKSIKQGKSYVVKVDQGVKKRFKQGLIKLDLKTSKDISSAISELKKQGFRYFLIEEFLPHDETEERYFALERTSSGIVAYFSKKGGVDVESFEGQVQELLLQDAEDAKKIAIELGVKTEGFIEKLIEAFDIYYFSFLEINPLVISFKTPHLLDVAGEVDSAAEFFVEKWNSDDFQDGKKDLTQEEQNVSKLSEKSQASFKLVVLNPQGSIFMLLSGGGASIVLADEVYNLGKGHELANYGEYSGNPNEEETLIYTKNILNLLLKSNSQNKVLIIGGGVANFTDIRITFRGVVRALGDVRDELKIQNVRIFVRRGGPHQDEGLALMRKFLEENGIEGEVYGPELVLTDIVSKALEK